ILTFDTQCYGDRKGQWTGEPDAINPAGYCKPLGTSFKTIEKTAEESELNTVYLFPAMVYGNGGWFEELVHNMESGKAKVVEPGDNYLSLIHVEDLAVYYALAAERINSSEYFNISDDRPVMQRVLVDHIADLIGVPSPPMVSFAEYSKEFGPLAAEAMSISTRVSGIKAIDFFDYAPRQRSYETGVAYTLEKMGIKLREKEEAA
ncbi:MAG: hypothetical protein ABSG42_00385, partial [Nitrospirota bacterium]